jgi:hypothetical protein
MTVGAHQIAFRNLFEDHTLVAAPTNQNADLSELARPRAVIPCHCSVMEDTPAVRAWNPPLQLPIPLHPLGQDPALELETMRAGLLPVLGAVGASAIDAPGLIASASAMELRIGLELSARAASLAVLLFYSLSRE